MSQKIETNTEETCIKAIKNDTGKFDVIVKGDVEELRDVLFALIDVVSEVIGLECEYLHHDEDDILESDKITIH